MLLLPLRNATLNRGPTVVGAAAGGSDCGRQVFGCPAVLLLCNSRVI